MSPTVSIILPTYRRPHFIKRAIDSVFAQTFQDWELLVVDDCSPDNTEEIVRGISDPRIRYLRHEQNQGGAAARNTGIRAAGPSQYLAYLDDDDEWLPEKLERQLAIFNESKDPDLGAVGCGRLTYSKRRVITTLPRVRGRIFHELLAGRASGTGTPLLLVKRFPSQSDVLFDEEFPAFQDREYLLRIARDYSIDFVWEPLVKVHREDDGSHVANHANAAKAYRLLLEKFRSDIEPHPGFVSYFYVRIANELALQGRMKEARQHLGAALASNPRSPRIYCWFTASHLGKWWVRLCHRLIPVSAPRSRPGYKSPALELV